MQTDHPDNAGIRAQLLAHYEARLKVLFADKPGTRPRLSFDAIEAAVVRSGDEAARALMQQALSEAMVLPKCTNQGRCKCGRNLQWSDKPRTLETVRGSVTVTRLHGYCRVCERGFFPLGPTSAVTRTPSKPAPAQGTQRDGHAEFRDGVAPLETLGIAVCHKTIQRVSEAVGAQTAAQQHGAQACAQALEHTPANAPDLYW